MRMGVGAVLVLGLSLGTAGAQTPPQPAPQGQMDGMDMGQGPSQPKGAGAAMDMDMSHCGAMGQGGGMRHCMGMKGMAMDHGKKMPPLPAGAMRVSFDDKSADWTPATLAALPHKTITVHNTHSMADETYAGVPLVDLLTKLGLPAKPMGKDMAFYLEAVGSDGFIAVYSAAEVNPDVHDATVIVADTENGKPLTGDGPLKLVATRETRPARWVRNLVAVKVLAAQ